MWYPPQSGGSGKSFRNWNCDTENWIVKKGQLIARDECGKGDLGQRRPGCTRTGFRLLFKCQQVAKSKLPFQKLQHGKHVGILLVGGKMVHLTYDSWKTGIKRSWPFLSFKAWRTLPSRGGRQSCWNMSFVVLNGVRRLHLHKARRMARFSE